MVALLLSAIPALLGLASISEAMVMPDIKVYSGFMVPGNIADHGRCRTADDWTEVFKSVEDWFAQPGTHTSGRTPSIRASEIDCNFNGTDVTDSLTPVLKLASSTNVKVLFSVSISEGPGSAHNANDIGMPQVSRLVEILSVQGCDGLIGIVAGSDDYVDQITQDEFGQPQVTHDPSWFADKINLARSSIRGAHATCAKIFVGHEEPVDVWQTSYAKPLVDASDFVVLSYSVNLSPAGVDNIVSDVKVQLQRTVDMSGGKTVLVGNIGCLSNSFDWLEDFKHATHWATSSAGPDVCEIIDADQQKLYHQKLVCDGALDHVSYWWNGAFHHLEGSDGVQYSGLTPPHPNAIETAALQCN